MLSGFWLLMMGSLWLRESRAVTHQVPARQILPSEPSETWLGVFRPNGEPAGYLHVDRRPVQRMDLAGLEVQLDARLDGELGALSGLVLRGSTWNAVEEARAELDLAVTTSGRDVRLRGAWDGEHLEVEVGLGERTLPLRLPVRGDLVFTQGLGTALHLPSMRVGDTVTLQGFDFLRLGVGRMTVHCRARETLTLADGTAHEAVRLEIRAAGLQTVAWADADGVLLKAETPMGLVLERLDAAAGQALKAAAPWPGDAP